VIPTRHGVVAAEAEDAESGNQVFEPGSQVSFDFSVTYNTKYVWRGINVVDGSVLQPSATVSYRDLSLNVWGNRDLTGKNGQRGDFTEYDVTLDYSLWSWRNLWLNVGTIYYKFPHSDAPSTNELYASVGMDTILSPSLTVYQDVDEADGTYASFSVGHEIADAVSFSETAGLDIALTASLGYGSSNYNDFYYSGVDSSGFTDVMMGISFPIRITENFVLTPAVNYSELLDSDIRDSMSDDSNVWGGLTASYSF
jgi:hypothetical protein